MSAFNLLFHLIPKWVHNRIVLSAYDLIALFPLSARKAEEHFQSNVTQLTRILQQASTGFLENQAELTQVRFGSRSGISALFPSCYTICETIIRMIPVSDSTASVPIP